MYDFLNNALFPTFRKFVSGDYSAYKNVYEKYFAPYADISPANLLEWLNIDKTLEISRMDNAIILRYANPFEEGELNYLILERRVSKKHMRELYKFASPSGKCVIHEQPRALLAKLEEDPNFVIEPNRASYEYILDVEQHASVAGPEFYRQRYEVRAFERMYAGHTIKIVAKDVASNADKKLLTQLLSEWPLTANTLNESKENREREAIKLAIGSLRSLHRPFAFLYLDDTPIAFSLFAQYGEIAIVGHVKVNYDIPFVFDYMVYRLAKLFKERSIKYINFEQDLGIEGLRAHKTRLRPVRMLEKVDVMPVLVKARQVDSPSGQVLLPE